MLYCTYVYVVKWSITFKCIFFMFNLNLYRTPTMRQTGPGKGDWLRVCCVLHSSSALICNLITIHDNVCTIIYCVHLKLLTIECFQTMLTRIVHKCLLDHCRQAFSSPINVMLNFTNSLVHRLRHMYRIVCTLTQMENVFPQAFQTNLIHQSYSFLKTYLFQFDMCPLCNQCDRWKLSDICLYKRISYLFDHPGTVFYAIFMSFWGERVSLLVYICYEDNSA